MDTTIINIPLQGFYSSIWSEVDHIEEREAESLQEMQDEEGIPPELQLTADEFSGILLDVTDHSNCYLSIAHAYADAVNLTVSEYLDIPLGLKFESISSPREYNFTTDRLFCYIPCDVVERLFAASAADGHSNLLAVIKDRFTSYDGFLSHYDNELEPWLAKPLADWDHNELCTLLIAVMQIAAARGGACTDETNSSIVELVLDGEGIYQEWSDSVDWKKFEEAVAEARAEKAEAFAVEHPGLPVPEVRCQLTLELPL